MATTCETFVKYERIAEDVERRIRSSELPPGRTIPSYRELMAEYGVAMGTVRQAVGLLQSRGLVRAVSGRGCVVSPVRQDWRFIGLAAFCVGRHSPSPLLEDALLVTQKALAERHCDMAVRVVEARDEREIEAFYEWAKRLEGVIVRDLVSEAVLRRLVEFGVPTVLVGEVGAGDCPPGVSYIRLDYRAAISMALGHLTALGHRRVTLVNRTGSNHYANVSAQYHGIMAEQGLGDFVDEITIPTGGDERRIVEHMRKRTPPPTALLIEGGIRSRDMVGYLAQAGWPVPERVSVLAVSGVRPGRLVPRSVSGVVSASDDILTRAIRALVQSIRDGTGHYVRESIVPELNSGETCRPAAGAAEGAFREVGTLLKEDG